MYQAKSGVKKFSLYWGGGSLNKNFFFPVWTCIKPNLVSKIFPFTRGGGSSKKNFFFQSEHVSSQIWCQKIFPLLGGGFLENQKFFFPVWTCIKPNLVSKIFPFTETGTPPYPRLDQPIQKSETWDPPLSKAGSAYPKIWDLGHPPPDVNRQTPVKTVPSRRTTYAGGKNISNRFCTMFPRPSRHWRKKYFQNFNVILKIFM